MIALIVLLLLQANAQSIDIQSVTRALREKQFRTAVELTGELLARDRQNARVWTLQGLAHEGLGQHTQALGDFQQAVKLSPDYLPALQAEAQLEYSAQDARCPETLNRIVTLDPANAVGHAMLAALAYRRQDCPAVVANYSASEALIASQAPALTEYGQCLFGEQKRERAAQAFAKAVALEPDSWQARYNLAVADLLLDHPADSLAAVKPMQTHPKLLAVAASAYERMGDTPQAVSVLRQAIVREPGNAALYLQFADLSFAHKSFPIGVDMLTAGLQKSPHSAQLYLARGVLRVQMGQYPQAQSDFEKAAQLDPSQAYSSVAQGLTQLQQSNLDGALAITRDKLRQSLQDAYLHYLEAEILHQKGVDPGTADFAEALSAVQTAVRLQPEFPLATDLLGTFYLRQGKLSLAIEQFEKVLQVEPDNESALYHLITASRKDGKTELIPGLMRHLAEAKAAHKKLDEQTDRYSFIGANRTQ